MNEQERRVRKPVKGAAARLPEEGALVPKTFGPYLARLRREQRLSQREAAAELGISNGYLALLETGERQPRATVTLAQRIAAAFGRPTAEVFAEMGLHPETSTDRTTLLDSMFRHLVLHPDLMPRGMDATHWLDSFSARQKSQIIELAQNLYDWDPPDEEDETEEDSRLLHLLEGFPADSSRRKK